MMPEITNRHSKPICRVVWAGTEFTGKQALLYAPGISAESVGAQRIHLQIVTIPPGGRAKAYKHEAHETAIHVLSGLSGMWYGQKLEEHLLAQAGHFLYIPANMPHLPHHPTDPHHSTPIIAPPTPTHQQTPES